ncbi:MAG: protein phosphatase 2C domain-containing protein [Pseudomonadota bacterium]
MKYEIGQVNRLGNRSINQDRFSAIETGEGVLLILGDGMGGQACGEVAAQLLIDTAHNAYLAATRPIEDPKTFLQEILVKAHKAIVAFGRRQNPPVTPGTTGVVCLIQDGHAIWAHVGDSRLYIFQGGLALYRTTDHSYVEHLFQQGAISRREQDNHPKRNQITQCIGCRKTPPEVTLSNTITLKPDDIVLLCSDGLWGPLDDAQMGSHLREGETLDDLLNEMAEKAERLSYPRCDNISGLALRYISNESTPQVPQEVTSAAPGQDETDELESAIAKIEAVLKEYEKEIKR